MKSPLRRRIAAVAGEGATLTLVCDASHPPLACGPSGVSEMKPTAAPVTQTVSTALAAASIGLSLFVLPGGGGSLRPLPVVPATSLVAGRIAASLEAPRHAAAASPRVSTNRVAAVVSTRAGGGRHVARAASPRTRERRAAPRRTATPSPVPAPPATPVASAAPTVPPANGRGKAKSSMQVQAPPGLSRSAGRGRARGHDQAPQGHPAGRSSPRNGGQGDHGNHGGEQHGGGGP
jgi:hypothetical protein